LSATTDNHDLDDQRTNHDLDDDHLDHHDDP
jgi:hypothetical protein